MPLRDIASVAVPVILEKKNTMTKDQLISGLENVLKTMKFESPSLDAWAAQLDSAEKQLRQIIRDIESED